jgi:hypothetical protein
LKEQVYPHSDGHKILDGCKVIDIATRRPTEKSLYAFDYPGIYNRRVHYAFRENTLEVSHQYNEWYDIMTDEMATSLINTIDALIPGSTLSTPQPDRRARHEQSTPMKLPAPGRRTPAR